MDRADLAALQTFLAIAKHGSLRAAARALGVNPPAVSHQLKAFEERLGAPLFLRSTRSIALTDAGKTLLEDSRHLLDSLERALERTRDAQTARAGRLRITLPYRAWQIIVAPRLSAFHALHPEIELELEIDEALIDIVAGGFHAGVRLGDHLQEHMIAIRLSDREDAVLVAAPDYIARHGAPESPHDLDGHVCIRHRRIRSGRVTEWRFATADGEMAVNVAGTLILNDLRTIVDAARRGLGIGWSLRRGVRSALARGELVEVLPGMTPSRPGFHLYYPPALQSMPLLRAFIAHYRPQRSEGAGADNALL